MEVFCRGKNDDSGIRMFVRDPECIIESILNLASPESWVMHVQIMYLERAWCFSGKA